MSIIVNISTDVYMFICIVPERPKEPKVPRS